MMMLHAVVPHQFRLKIIPDFRSTAFSGRERMFIILAGQRYFRRRLRQKRRPAAIDESGNRRG